LNEVKAQLSTDPLAQFILYKERLDKLGSASGKTSAQDQMYKMDSKKLDTLLEVVKDTHSSLQTKADRVIDILGPFAQNYIQNLTAQMRAMRGVQDVPRSEQDYEKAAQGLEELERIEQQLKDKAMASDGDQLKKTDVTDVSDKSPVFPEPPKKTISIPPTKKRSEPKKTKK
jgi:hypothetical protein